MKLKYTGPLEEITIREVTFVKGKPVEVDDDLRAKVSKIEGFKSVQRRKVKSNDQNLA